MGLLGDIQTALLNEQPLGPILLRLRFLAARLGSDALAEWVKHEADGYPPGVIVPEYRQFGVSFTGSFNGAFGRMISNVAIPPTIIANVAGKDWLTHSERQSVSAIEDLIRSSQKANGNPQINAADLTILLSNKVYQGMACHSVHGVVSRSAMVEMMETVRARVLDLTLELEKAVPEAAEITAGQVLGPPEPEKSAVVTNITNQIIHGSTGANIATSGIANINVSVKQGDIRSLESALEQGGIPASDAADFAKIVSEEVPEGSDQPFGKAARAWIEANIGKALSGAWKVGAAVATGLLTAAAKQFYGLP
jgi:hypothetical protein